MEDNENILKKAVDAIKNEPIPTGPPQNVVDATLAKLREGTGEQNSFESRQIPVWERFIFSNNLFKMAAAIILFLFVGFAGGRLTGPKPIDKEQLRSEIETSLRASLEPDIREQVLSQTKQYLQLGFVNCYAQLKDDLSQQYRQDLYQVAAQTLAAYNTTTNQLLENLIETINVAQTQNRQWTAAALEEVELNRQRDTAQLSNAFVNFATQTEDELQRTKQLLYREPDDSAPKKLENNNIN
jgi:hypothetical protein